LVEKSASIAPTTFHPLRSLESLDLDFSITEKQNIINKELFMYSTNLRTLRLCWNGIQAIHPKAIDNLDKLTFLNLSGNNCVDEIFKAPENEEEIDMALIKKKLEKCFENFYKQVAP
jgi:hypothetical protein